MLSPLRNFFRPTAAIFHRATGDGSTIRRTLETSRVATLLILLTTVVALVLLCFVGISPTTLPIRTGEIPSAAIIARSPFRYESELLRDRRASQVRDRVAPVYRLDPTHFTRFSAHVADLLDGLDSLTPPPLDDPDTTSPAPADPAATSAAVARLTSRFNDAGPYHLRPEDTAAIASLSPGRRREAAESALQLVGELHEMGVYEPGTGLGLGTDGSLGVFNLVGGSGSEVRAIPLESALARLRAAIATEGLPRDASLALFRILRPGVVGNLVFDPEETRRRQDDAVARLGPATVDVAAGETLVEAGRPVTPEAAERFQAYRRHLADAGDSVDTGDRHLGSRFIQVLAMVLAAVAYIRLEDRRTLRSNSRLALIALVAVANVAVVRLTVWLGQTSWFLANDTAAAVLPFVAPVTLAPLLLAILIGPGPGTFMGLLVSFLTGVIYGGRLDVMVLSFLASIVAIYACRTIRFRSRVVRAAGAAGACVALFAILEGLVRGSPPSLVALQAGAALLGGTLTGSAVLGLLPILESLFQHTTDITLLELTDYNHPLLRRMQVEAPGTYHHSLVVAQLAENAAAAIAANPLLARVCSLFHDVGKLKQPEYFTENQRGANPHDDRNPSISAIIIRNHVKEGVALASTHKLPRPILDVIRQHHGTSLLQFFYQRARERARGPGGTHAPIETVPEEIYRYDGPKPQFRESAIIHLADSCEAASRSLRKITPQSVSELVEKIVEARVDDGQLDECPLTLEELSKIKSSFTFTLLSMLHQRVPYTPDPAKPPPVEEKQATPHHPSPGPADAR